MTRILVSNDDGIHSPGLHALVDALSPLAEIVVIAPDRNRSAVSRGITLGQTLSVDEHEVPGASLALSTDGTPTDCVRLAALGLAGDRPDLVVSGANLGLNLGDDVTYSGTVAIAFESMLQGISAVAVSQQEIGGTLGYPRGSNFDWRVMQHFVQGLVRHMLESHASSGSPMLVNVNVPGVVPEQLAGVEVGRLGRRIYRDRLELKHRSDDGRRHYSVYGDDPSHHKEEGTDIAAIGRHCIAVTPLRFNLTDPERTDELASWPLAEIARMSATDE